MRRRDGFVLVYAVAVLGILVVLTSGMLFIAAQENRIARARLAALRARLAAEAAVRATVASWRTDEVAGMEPGAAVGPTPCLDSAPVSGCEITVQRLGSSAYRLRAEAFAGPPARPLARRRAEYLVRTIEPREPWADFPAALTTVGYLTLGAAGTIDGRDAHRTPDAWPPHVCGDAPPPPSGAEFLGDARAGVALSESVAADIHPDAVLRGRPPVLTDTALHAVDAFDAIGPLGVEAIRQIADRVESGHIAPVASEHDGICEASAPGNWGAPRDPGSPCAAYFPLIHSPGDLEVVGGAGQGILVVEGDLELRDGAVFYGAVWVRGGLRLHGNAAIRGAVRVAARTADARIDAGEIRYSDCALARAFTASPALDRAFRPTTRAWLPAF